MYSRYVPNLTRRDGSAMERLLASRWATESLGRKDTVQAQGVELPNGTDGSSSPATVSTAPMRPARPRLRSITGGKAANSTSALGAHTDAPGDPEPQPPPSLYMAQIQRRPPMDAASLS